MNNRIICSNDNIGYYVNYLTMNNYKYIIKANDKFLSGWGQSTNRKHIQLIACKTEEEKDHIIEDLTKDNAFNYINWYYIPNENDKIIKLSYRYSYTIRNDWSR
jgi:hypothetical protein